MKKVPKRKRESVIVKKPNASNYTAIVLQLGNSVDQNASAYLVRIMSIRYLNATQLLFRFSIRIRLRSTLKRKHLQKIFLIFWIRKSRNYCRIHICNWLPCSCQSLRQLDATVENQIVSKSIVCASNLGWIALNPASAQNAKIFLLLRKTTKFHHKLL